MDTERRRTILVTGDVLRDHHIYAGERNSPKADRRRGMSERREIGGAALIHRLLAEALNGECRVDLQHGQSDHTGYAVWEPVRIDPADKYKDDIVWRTRDKLGYGTAEHEQQVTKQDGGPGPYDILVIDDAGLGFRRSSSTEIQTLLGRVAKDGHILLKMSAPAGREGPENLWREIANHRTTQGPQRDVSLVGLIAANELRQKPLGLSEALSWEASLDDLRLALAAEGPASHLRLCDQLVVTFSIDAAVLLIRGKAGWDGAWVCLDPHRAENEWSTRLKGDVIGVQAVMAAALAHGLARIAGGTGPGAVTDGQPPLVGWLRNGLIAGRNLYRFGHGPLGPDPKGFPVDRVAAALKGLVEGPLVIPDKFKPFENDSNFGTFRTDWPDDPDERPDFSLIVEDQIRLTGRHDEPLLHVARQVVRYGPRALDHLPHARFGAFITAERPVIETLRFVRRKMLAYRANPKPERPLSIGVFGPPGAGKSFGVKQLAIEVFDEASWKEFNLSQFRDSQDLNGAFHQVRDQALRGLTPVVFWDEFDSKSLDWLQYLLAPMQDGRFQDGQLHHAIGKCVFVFAGGTSPTFRQFKAQEGGEGIAPAVAENFRVKKGKDFTSRLDAHIDVLGPNIRRRAGDVPDTTDRSAPLRRALMIRHHLRCGETALVDFDDGLLEALLLEPYLHGARSLEKVVESLRGRIGTSVRRSDLPRAEQLGMHVDEIAFDKRMDTIAPPPVVPFTWEQIEIVARRIHEGWYTRTEKQDRSRLKDTPRDWDALNEPQRNANRAAVGRMPMILALAGLSLRYQCDSIPPGKPIASDHDYRERLKPRLEFLAEAEHDGWVDQRDSSGWRYHKDHDDTAGYHPAMVPYAQLSEYYKENDRENILNYFYFCKKIGWHIIVPE